MGEVSSSLLSSPLCFGHWSNNLSCFECRRSCFVSFSLGPPKIRAHLTLSCHSLASSNIRCFLSNADFGGPGETNGLFSCSCIWWSKRRARISSLEESRKRNGKTFCSKPRQKTFAVYLFRSCQGCWIVADCESSGLDFLERRKKQEIKNVVCKRSESLLLFFQLFWCNEKIKKILFFHKNKNIFIILISS